MVTVPLAEAKDHLSALVSDISSTHAHYTITRNGRAAVVMLPVDDLEALEETIFWLERELEQLRAGALTDDGPGISGAEMDEVIQGRRLQERDPA